MLDDLTEADFIVMCGGRPLKAWRRNWMSWTALTTFTVSYLGGIVAMIAGASKQSHTVVLAGIVVAATAAAIGVPALLFIGPPLTWMRPHR
jgi:hypothetical protein